MEQLSKKIAGKKISGSVSIPQEDYFQKPERVLQFGTGVLLRGLPDYFIDKANKQGVFNGRIVVVKSTSRGGTDAFSDQQGLFCHSIKGIHHGEKVNEVLVNASISRVLAAADDWKEILALAAKPEMDIIISNTTEVGLTYLEEDISGNSPASFPGKLVAWLFERFNRFSGDPDKGVVVVPTELIVENGKLLQSICNKVADYNKLPSAFTHWMNQSCHFCDSLVDRIVPGKLSTDQQQLLEEHIGFSDELSIISEPYALWAIEEKNQAVKQKLCFSSVNPEVVIAPDISKFRKLKLHLLNGTHTFCSGLAFLCGFDTVSESMENPTFRKFIEYLSTREIIPEIVDDQISPEEAKKFALAVLDRFSNPFIEHHWLSITLNYSSKMKVRNGGVMEKRGRANAQVPEGMALCFASMLVFLKLSRQEGNQYWGTFANTEYSIQDEQALLFQIQEGEPVGEYINRMLSDKEAWGSDLQNIPGFSKAVSDFYAAILEVGALETLRKLMND